MSAINSTAGAGLSQFLQNLTSGGTASASNSSSGSTSTLSSLLGQVGHHHKHHGGAFEKLTNAITNALQSASGNASTSSTASDANKTIIDALTKIFKNGSLGAASDNDDEAQSTVGSSTATGAAATAPGTAAAQATQPPAGLPAEFLQTLKAFGVTAQQFQSDLATAVKSAHDTGAVDVSAAFKSFPIGSVVDSVG